MIVVSIVLLGCVCLVFFFFQFEDFRVNIFVGRQPFFICRMTSIGDRSSLENVGKHDEN